MCVHQVLSQMTLLLDHSVIDPSQQSLAFPMNVIALLPYMVQNYEDANELCIRSAENIAQVRKTVVLFHVLFLSFHLGFRKIFGIHKYCFSCMLFLGKPHSSHGGSTCPP